VTTPFLQAFDATYPIGWVKVSTKRENVALRDLIINCLDTVTDNIGVDIQPGVFEFQMSGCEIDVVKGLAIAIYGVHNMRVHDNVIHRQTGRRSAVSTCHGGHFSRNKFFNKTAAISNGCLTIETGTSFVAFDKNQFFGGTGGSGCVYVNDTNYCTFDGNLVAADASTIGIYIVGGSDNTFSDNTCVNVLEGIRVSASTSPTPDLNSSRNTINGLIVRNATYGLNIGAGGISTIIEGLNTDSTVTTAVQDAGTGTLYLAREKGTWTPSITFSTPGNLSVAYTTQTGVYERVGNKVFVEATIVTSTFTHTTASGELRIGTLPITPSATISVLSCTIQGYTKANYTMVTAEAQTNTYLRLPAQGSGQSLAFLAASDMPTGGSVNIRISGWYEV
jgi:parallel beta-helix repeat protein